MYTAWQWFAISVAVLALGPALLAPARRLPWLLRALDGFVLVAVGGLVVLDVLPEAIEHGGWAALVLVAAGLFLPGWLEHRLHDAARLVHTTALVVGVVGLALHAGLDGVVLAGARDAEARGLATAVLLHRLPEGLTVWWLLRPGFGPRVAALALAAVAAATAIGVEVASHTADAVHGGGLAWVQALVGGSLLHVVVHRAPTFDDGRAAPPPTGPQWAAGLGACAGVALLAFVLNHHEHDEARAQQSALFWSLAKESAPALLVAYVAAGFVQVFLPVASLQWLGRGGRWSQAVRGAVFGLPLPICSCGVVPVYRSLALQGVPPAAGLAFLVATPELGVDAVLLSWPLLGGTFAVVRVAAATLVAILVGAGLAILVERGFTGPALRVEPAPPPAKDQRLPARVKAGLRIGLGEMVDHTAPWVLVGLVVAALGEPLLHGGALARTPHGLDVILFALIGIPIYICASGATPLVAVLVGHGLSPGAGLALLLTGPATNLSTFGVLARLHGCRLALAFGAAVALLAIVLGLAVNLALGVTIEVPALAAAAHDHHGGDLTLAALGVLVVASVLRQGPRAFLGQVLDVARPGGGHGDHDDHDHHGGDAVAHAACGGGSGGCGHPCASQRK